MAPSVADCVAVSLCLVVICSADLLSGPSDFSALRGQEVRWMNEKRRPISVNQDLMSLSRMMDHGPGKTEQAQNFLSLIGKRSNGFRYRRNDRLSVGMPLRTISGMIQAQRRRQYVDKASSAHNKLMNIGKRAITDSDFDF